MIDVKALRKSFGDKLILNDVSCEIKQGDKDLTETMEQLFGEEKISLCRRVIKGNGSAEN